MATKTFAELTKADEISLIEKLVNGNGYFAEFFKPSSERMIQNIRNDFPIELQTSFNSYKEKNEDLVKDWCQACDQINSQQVEIARLNRNIEALEDLKQSLLGAHLRGFDVKMFYTFEEIVKSKLRLNVELTDEERTEIASRL